MSLPPASRPRRFGVIAALWLAAGIGVCGPSSALAQPADPALPPPPVTISQGKAGPQRPDAATRTVRLFDFEEMSTNPTLLPRFWLRARAPVADSHSPTTGGAGARAGFPAWNEAELDYTAPAWRGKGSVRLPTAGGSTALVLEPGVLPVLQNADYTITAMIRTAGLRDARARLIACFLDQAGTPIPASQAAGELIVSEAEWKPTAIELIGNYDDAAFIEIELQLLQPQEQGRTRSPHAALSQDLSGAAWFDNVTVMQLPRIELTTNGPGNVIARPHTPELRLDVRDLTGEALRAQITVFDASGKVVDRAARSIGSGRAREPWRPKIESLGWYRAVLRIFNDTSLVGQSTADFVWVDSPRGPARARAGGPAGSPDTKRFSLNVGPLRGSLATDLPEIVSRVSTGGVIVPVWGLTPLPAAARDGKPSRTAIDTLIESGQEVTLSLDRLPEALAVSARSDPADPWPVLAGNQADWDPYLGPLLEKYGQRVRRWMVGQPGDDRAFWRSSLREDLAAIDSAIGRLVPGPMLGVPWRIDRGLRPEALSPTQTLVAALVPQDSSPEQIGDFAELWKSAFAGGHPQEPELTLVMESPSEELYGYDGAIDELARRAVEFWRAFDAPMAIGGGGRAPSAALALPWNWSVERRPKLRPRPELAVWANLINRLCDRRVVGTFAIAEGVTCYILAPAPGAPSDRTGALVAWNESAPPDLAVLRSYLGEGPVTVVDVFGNSAPAPYQTAPQPAGDAASTGRAPRRPNLIVPIGPRPVFIEGIDPVLARFIGSVRIDPAMLTATSDAHEHALVFTNPWQTSLDLRAFIVQPGGLDAAGGKDRRWKISPRSSRAIVPPGQEGRLPMTIAFSPAEEAGLKEFLIDLEVTATQPYGLIRLAVPVKLGLDGFSIELTHVASGGRDVIVEAQISNTSNEPIDLELTASAPGFPRSKAPVSALPPGGTVVRRFPYPAALEKLRGKRVSVAAFDSESKARLNRTVVIE